MKQSIIGILGISEGGRRKNAVVIFEEILMEIFSKIMKNINSLELKISENTKQN